MSKATFKNIGPIKDADLELGNLTIIAGQNNTGKTYLVYTLYGFLKFLREIPIYSLLTNRNTRENINRIAGRLNKTKRYEMNLEDYYKLENNVKQEASSAFSHNFIGDVFNSPNNEFKNSQFNAIFENKKNAGKFGIYNSQTKSSLSVEKNHSESRVVFKLDANNGIPIGTISDWVIGIFARVNSPDPFILSAERFGISLFYKELDFTRNRLVEELQKMPGENFNPFDFLKDASSRYARPVSDNINFTRDLLQIQRQKRKLLKDNNRSVEKIMDGYYKATSNEIRFISKRRGENRFDIPLHLASSSARGVSDLYFYLKHIASSGQLLIIDEPESHLSPTNQVLMARLLVFCVNAGIKILITTHSDYLIKEINNLIMLHGTFEGKKEFIKNSKKNYTEIDSIDQNSVKAYVCQDGELNKCSIDETGIDMPVFDDAIDRINKFSNDLYLLKSQASK